jgi:hypothetical protein
MVIRQRQTIIHNTLHRKQRLSRTERTPQKSEVNSRPLQRKAVPVPLMTTVVLLV